MSIGEDLGIWISMLDKLDVYPANNGFLKQRDSVMAHPDDVNHYKANSISGK